MEIEGLVQDHGISNALSVSSRKSQDYVNGKIYYMGACPK